MTEGLSDLILNFKRDAVLQTVERRLGAGEDPLRVLDDCRRGMTLVGERFQEGDIFLAELILSAEIFKEVAATIEPRLPRAKPGEARGRVLMGTLQGDIHELGKNIVVTLLRAHGFEVHDLGVDVPPSAVVEKVEQFQPHVVGFSALITTAFHSMKEAVVASRGGRPERPRQDNGRRRRDHGEGQGLCWRRLSDHRCHRRRELLPEDRRRQIEWPET